MDESDFLTQPPAPPVTPNLAVVVDDVEVNRILARAHLELLGWTVEDCDSGQRALMLLHRKTPAAMLIDVRMPGLSGDELARRIRRTVGPDVLLVAYTAHCMPEDVQRIKKAGFDQVLIKPVSFGEMSAVFARRPGAA